jgi:hypothetical protein
MWALVSRSFIVVLENWIAGCPYAPTRPTATVTPVIYRRHRVFERGLAGVCYSNEKARCEEGVPWRARCGEGVPFRCRSGRLAPYAPLTRIPTRSAQMLARLECSRG